MKNLLEQYYAAKELAESRQRAADKAVGARDQLKKQLQEEFAVSTLAKGNALLTELSTKEQTQRKQLSKALEEFEQEYMSDD